MNGSLLGMLGMQETSTRLEARSAEVEALEQHSHLMGTNLLINAGVNPSVSRMSNKNSRLGFNETMFGIVYAR